MGGWPGGLGLKIRISSAQAEPINDPHNQNKNGEMFSQFLSRNENMTILNSLELCEGLITRKRIANGKVEKSVIDFALVCNIMLPYVKKFFID